MFWVVVLSILAGLFVWRLKTWTPPSTTSDLSPPLSSATFDAQYEDLEHELNSLRLSARKGEIPPSDYEYRLEKASGDVDFLMKELRSERKLKLIDEDDYLEQLEQLQYDRDLITERQAEFPYLEFYDQTEAKDPRWSEGQIGKWANFDYLSGTGHVTKRKITMWRSQGRYITGFDKEKNEERTFRKGKIENWISS